MPKDQPKKAPKKSTDTVALQQQVNELTTALQRERADAVNIRRQHDVQLANLRTTVKSTIVAELLPIIDNFERALKHVPKDLERNSYVQGVQAIVKQFESTLEGLGVQRIATTGQAFDPKYHEAVSMEDGEGEHEIVAEELQPGYRIGEDVIRHAMVRVKRA